MRRFTGEYAKDGREKRKAAREAAGNRCLRCGHPYESGKYGRGKYGRGEWSLCDEKCTHKGPIRVIEAHRTVILVDCIAGELVKTGDKVEAQWRILTVHHFDGDKANDAWWNGLSLCQRCYLEIQSMVDPNVPWFLEHSEWLKPSAAGFYAWKYEGRLITREEAEARLDELLAYEIRTA